MSFINNYLICLHLCQRLLELRNPLAFLPMAILRAIPMNLLAIAAAVAVRLAPLAELAIGAVQRSAANRAALSKIAQMLLKVRNSIYPIIRNPTPGPTKTTRRK